MSGIESKRGMLLSLLFVTRPFYLTAFPPSVRLQLMRVTAPSWKPVGKPSLSSCVGSKTICCANSHRLDLDTSCVGLPTSSDWAVTCCSYAWPNRSLTHPACRSHSLPFSLSVYPLAIRLFLCLCIPPSCFPHKISVFLNKFILLSGLEASFLPGCVIFLTVKKSTHKDEEEKGQLWLTHWTSEANEK